MGLIYETSHFTVHVGFPPVHASGAEVRALYIVTNKETGVEEYYHTVLYMVKEWVDHFTKATVMGEEPSDTQLEMDSLGISNLN